MRLSDQKKKPFEAANWRYLAHNEPRTLSMLFNSAFSRLRSFFGTQPEEGPSVPDVYSLHMARVIAVCNQKGGVGKTTTAVNLAAYLASLGRRTLLVDFDPQGNASSALGAFPGSLEKSIYHGVLELEHASNLITPSPLLNLHYVAAAPHLTGLRIELIGIADRDRALRRFLNAVRHEYAYVIIDLPPSMDLLFVNGLVAADEIIVPVQAEYYSLEGLTQLLATVDLIRQNLGHNLVVAGALLTMHDAKERFSREVAANLRKHFPYHVFTTEIPRSVALAEAPSFGKPVILHRPDSDGAKAYRDLAREVIAGEATHLPPQIGTAAL